MHHLYKVRLTFSSKADWNIAFLAFLPHLTLITLLQLVTLSQLNALKFYLQTEDLSEDLSTNALWSCLHMDLSVIQNRSF